MGRPAFDPEKLKGKERDLWELYLSHTTKFLEEHRIADLESAGIACGSWMCVYFARMGDTTACKVGLAVHADSRMKQLQTSSPVPVRLVAWINAPRRDWLGDVEREAHKQASKHGTRLNGEWFDLDRNSIRRVVDGVVQTMPAKILGVNYWL